MAQNVVTPALLCHKEPAQGMQNAPNMVLYGIRISHGMERGGFHAQKESFIGSIGSLCYKALIYLTEGGEPEIEGDADRRGEPGRGIISASSGDFPAEEPRGRHGVGQPD